MDQIENILKTIRSSAWFALARSVLTGKRQDGPAPIVQPSSIAGHALTVVIAIMCFLACLTAGGVYMVNRSASAWFNDIASEVTVQIAPTNKADLEKTVTLVSLFLAKQTGITRVKPLEPEESKRLLEPWIGQSEALDVIPIPRLIAVEIDRNSPPDLAAVREALAANFKDVTLDDHRRWQSELKTVTRSLALGGIAVLALVAAATVATIISATRSAMASNREIVEVLHFVGAGEKFIAHEFEKHFLALGVRAALVGALAATFTFLLLPLVMRLLGGGSLAVTEIKRLIGTAVLDLPGYGLFLVVVAVVASLCMMTSRFGVFRILKAHD
jgi:cell division transport system permease protein